MKNANITKIVVHENGFDWYLRFSPDDEPPHSLNIDGKRKKSAKVSSLCYQQLRQLSRIWTDLQIVVNG